jgi:hypothetical protein
MSEIIGMLLPLTRLQSWLFPTKFADMKGIKGPMGEMRIPIKPYAIPFKQIPYKLNPKYKEKVNIELDRMLEAGIIEPVEESEWISPMVVQDKKTREIKIYVDLMKLNNACLHDPFPTPFIEKVLDNVGGAGGIFFYRRIFKIPSDPHCQGRAPQDHIFHRMGILPVYNNVIWLEE